MNAVTTHGLTKRYGATTVVDGLDLAVPEGCVYGFLGPNGSGKTTTMKMMLSLVRPSAGEARIFDQPITQKTRKQALRHVGSLIESPAAYGHLTGRENMRIVQRLVGADDDTIRRAVDAVRMSDQMSKLVREYSLGMKQRLGIAMALARDPRVLVLDEPTNGLDPAGIEEIRDLLVGLARNEGRTVIVSSHLLSEIEKMAQVLGILHRGQLLFQGTMTDLFQAQLPDIVIRTPEPDRAAHVTQRLAPVRVDGGIRLAGLDEPGVASVIAQLAAERVPIWEATRQQRSLEDIFIGLTGRDGLRQEATA